MAASSAEGFSGFISAGLGLRGAFTASVLVAAFAIDRLLEPRGQAALTTRRAHSASLLRGTGVSSMLFSRNSCPGQLFTPIFTCYGRRQQVQRAQGSEMIQAAPFAARIL